MSQAKVDKRKYEKIHRKEIERKRKIKFTVKCIVAALVLGTVIGAPTAWSIYKSMPKFVGDSTVQALVSDYIDEKYSSKIAGLGAEDTTESTEATDETAAFEEALEEATGSDVQAVNVDNIDEELGEDSEDATESSDEDK